MYEMYYVSIISTISAAFTTFREMSEEQKMLFRNMIKRYKLNKVKRNDEKASPFLFRVSIILL